MALLLSDLDDRTRYFMLDELEADVACRRLYLSPYLTDLGRREYEPALRAALRAGCADSLAASLRRPGRMGLPPGWQQGALVRALPSGAPDVLAEAEFHRFYVRGLCRRALADGIRALVIYRAKDGEPPRANADAMVGVRIDAASLLEDLQATSGRSPPRVLAGCPEPGMSVRLPSHEPGDGDPSTPEAGATGLSRAERRRMERHAAERRRAEHNTTPRRAIHGR